MDCPENELEYIILQTYNKVSCFQEIVTETELKTLVTFYHRHIVTQVEVKPL